MSATPAQIIQQVLLDASLTNPPVNKNTVWPSFISFLPDADDAPNDAIGIIDSMSVKQTRLMIGEVIERPGVQILVRSQKYDVGYARARAIVAELDEVINRPVQIDSTESYLITSVNRTSGVIPLGREPSGMGTKRRELFSINILFTVRAVTIPTPVLIWDGDTQSWDDDDLPWDP